MKLDDVFGNILLPVRSAAVVDTAKHKQTSILATAEHRHTLELLLLAIECRVVDVDVGGRLPRISFVLTIHCGIGQWTLLSC